MPLKGKSFGQERPPLTDVIKNILLRYPDGGQILKELIQNADDAGATEVRFLYDDTTYVNVSLVSPSLAVFQGPALYCYNSAQFTDEDWQGIQHLMRSNKKDKPLKVGRFGIGFNSVYHITDLPSIVSGNTVGFLDPHEKYFKRGEPGQSYSINDLCGENLAQNYDQFSPFRDIFGCRLEQGSYFKGTLFRFPLRVAPSELSKKIYTKKMVLTLFESFQTESSIILHFMKNIESISLYTRENYGPISQKYCVRLSDSCKADVRARRSELTANITTEWDYAPVSVFYTLKVEELYQGKLSQTRDWYMACQVGTTEERLISLAYELKLLPWIGVAYPVDVNETSFHKGRIFCFLPLPPDADCRTGLPVQVNGYFGLTDNRRSLKWPGPDCQNDDTAEWNELLLRTLGSQVYVSLIKNMIQLFSSKSGGSSDEMLTHASLVYSAIPRAREVKEDWQCILKRFFIELLRQKIFYTPASCGEAGWRSLDSVVLDRFDQSDESMNDVVRSTLLKLGQPVVTVPAHVLEIIDGYSRKSGLTRLQQITPRLLRDALRHSNAWLSMATEEKLLLLKYILQDSQFHDLAGIALLPLENDTFDVFQNFQPSSSRDTCKVYITSHEHRVHLLSNAHHRLLKESLPPALKQTLVQLTSQQHNNNAAPTQLFQLTKQDVLKLLCQTFPEGWSRNKTPGLQVVPWTPGVVHHPPGTWLEGMWQWIRKQFPYDLQLLEDVPLVPVSSHSDVLARLSRQSKMIFASDTTKILTSSLRHLLEACGCIIVDHRPPYLRHDFLERYISPPTAQGVLDLLMTSGLANVLQQLQTSSHETRCQLRSCLATLTLTSQHMSFIHALPIFTSLDGNHFLSCFVNNDRLPVAPQDFSVPPRTRVIDQSKVISSKDEESLALLKKLRMSIETTASLLMRHLDAYLSSSAYNDQEKDKLMLWVLRSMEILGAEDSSFTPYLSKLGFVPTVSGSRLAPCQLFDHTDQLLRDLFLDNPSAFAIDSFHEALEMRKSNLGIRCKNDLNANDLAEVMTRLTSPDNSLKRGQALLGVLNQRPALLTHALSRGSLLRDRLSQLAWLPRVVSPPDNYPSMMPWYNRATLCKPIEMCPSSMALLVGASRPLFDERLVGAPVQAAFSISNKNVIAEVVQQLRLAIQTWDEQENKPRGMELAKFVELLKRVYQEFLKNGRDLVQQLLTKAGISDWLWHGDGFTSPQKLAFTQSFPNNILLNPHLYLVPSDFHNLRNFLQSFGVKNKFQDEDLFALLESIKSFHDKMDDVSSAQVTQDLDCCRVILEWLVRDGRTLSDASRSKLYIPVQSCSERLRLEPCNECTYCDREFLRQGGSEYNVTESYHLIHKYIPDGLAGFLGVPRLSRCLSGAEAMGFIEEAGQHEPLTTRLRNILDEYKEGVAIFKELIQNADDAGAREVCFVVDWRETRKERLLAPDMAKCQGPALWAYNDAQFSQRDFENINHLAGGTKKEDLDKIGRFGLGFNAVYHLTDVPSFISGEYFVTFDPNMTHIHDIVGGKNARPGLKINLVQNHHVLSLFPDQFSPYNGLFGCNTKDSSARSSFPYTGTLFRFPLRTQQQANESEISGRACSREDISHMLQSLKTSAESLLLFAQNVKLVKVFEIVSNGDPTNAGLGEPLLTITKDVKVLRSECVDKEETFLRNVSNWWKDHARNTRAQKRSLRQMEQVTISVRVSNCKLINTERCEEHTDTWLVNSCSGQDSSIEMASSPQGQHSGLLPISGAAVKVQKIKTSVEFISVPGEVFCFLPLSFTSGLPVHVNANFAVLSNRRGLWEEGVGDHESMQPFEAKWNGALMSDALVRAYLQLLEVIKCDTAGTQYLFHSLWPDPSCVTHPVAWKPFIDAFFDTIIREQLPLFFCNKAWRALQNCLILDEKLNNVDHCVSIMTSFGFHVLTLPACFADAFRACGQADIIAQQTLTEDKFLRQHFFPNVASLSSDMRDSVLCYVLQLRLNKNYEYDELFHSHPCFSCSEDHSILRTPRELVHPRGKVAELFSPDEKRFPVEEKFLTEERAMMLEQLGMVVDHLNWQRICERADWIASRGVLEQKRAIFLIKYMTECLDGLAAPSEQETKRLKAAKILPFLAKPSDYPISWKGCEIPKPETLFSANDLYPRNLKNLVGCSKLIFDESAGSRDLWKLKRVLGLTSKKPDLKDVLTQLDNIIGHMNSSSAKASDVVKSICDAIYNHFEKLCSLKEQKDVLVYQLSRRPWILIENNMVKSSLVAMTALSSDCSPYLHSLPNHYNRKYPNLIKLCCVKERFTAEDIQAAVKRMRAGAADRAISKRQLRILQTFLEEITQDWDSECRDVSLPLPDSGRVICDGGSLVMNDAPWLTADNTIHYVHPTIPRKLGYQCGATPQVDALVIDASIPMGQPFGQHECLTDRLKGILKSYPADEGILKELVQNADDAKASEIHFVFDPRNHGNDGVFSEHWGELCGPAICVYNDKTFSQEDIQGIQNLGIGSKVDDPAKTGQYGIGFNAVYHFTDCPSFLSDDAVLCVSDPHLRYVPGASDDKPGRLFNRLDERFRANFQGVFTGFLGELFELKGATMFRFPLRSFGSAFRSHISSEVFFPHTVRKMFNTFRLAAKDMLLFLNNIKKISISEINKDGQLQTYSVSCSVSDEKTRRDFAQNISKFKATPTAEIPWHIIRYVMTISDTKKAETTWLVCQALGSKKLSDQHAVVPDGLKCGLLPRAGVAASVKGRYPHRSRHRAFCFLPLPVTTQLPVHVNGHFALDAARRDLWHDSSPDDERTKWNEFVKRHVIAPAYAYLIEEVRRYIPEIDGVGLGSFPSERIAQDGLRSYHKLFPCLNTAGSWKPVAEALYLFLANESMRVLPVAQSVPKSVKLEFQSVLCDITATPKLDASVPKPVAVTWRCVAEVIFSQHTCEDLVQMFLDLDMPLLSHTPSKVYDGFASCERATQVSPAVVIDFLRTRSNLRHHLPTLVEQTVLVNHVGVGSLLKYCLQDKDCFFKKLQDLPLLLTHDDILRNFSEHRPVFSSNFALLLPANPELFLHEHVKTFLHAHLAKSSGFITKFNLRELSKFKTSIFPETWGESKVHHPWKRGGDDGELGPTEEWIKTLWVFIDEVTSSKKAKERLDCILNDMQTWPIIPSVQGCLVPVSLSKTVLNQSDLVCYDTADEERRKLITSIGCAQLDSSLMPRTSTGGMLVRQQYLANIQSPKDVLGILSYTLNQPNNANKQDNFCGKKIMELLMFFQTNASHLERDMLKKLPFFLTVNGSYISLATAHKIYELPDGVSSDDCESLSRAVPCVFLRKKPGLQQLYKHIGIQGITAQDFYVSIVLKHFNSLSPEGRLRHLEFIRDYLRRLDPLQNEREYLLDVLNKLPFIPTANGVMHRACEFYDDAKKVFTAFEPKESFPPEPFNSIKKWRSFLRDVGLITQVSRAKFVGYAKLVEREVLKQQSSIAGKISEMSRVLVSYLFNHHSLHDQNFLHKISKIKFVEAARLKPTLLTIHPAVDGTSSPSANVVYIQFSGSVISKHQNLVWSTAPILSPLATPSLVTQCHLVDPSLQTQCDLIKALNICTTPPHTAVLSHIKNVAFRFYNMNDNQVPQTLRYDLSWLMKKLYRYLAECCPRAQNVDCASSPKCQETQIILHRVPFILISESFFVRCEELAFNRARKALEPYLFEVPRDLKQYEHFLKQLGAQETVTPLQYSRVLQALQESCQGEEMHQLEQRTALTSTRGLFNSLHDNKFDASQSLEHTPVLYLPTADHHLKSSTELLVNDSMEPKERLTQYLSRLLIDFSEANKERAEKLVQLLPDRLKLRNLSSEVEQTLSPDCIDQLCLLDQCEFIARYRQLLCSREFSDGLVRLFKCQEKKTAVSNDDKAQLKSMESRLTLTCMQSIRTTLVSVITGEAMERSEKEESCFLQNIDQKFKMFLKHGQESSSILHFMMASFVHRVTGRLVERETWPHLMIMLEAEDPCEISAKLDEARVPTDVTASYTELMPGDKILEHFHFLLRNDMRYHFREGELVAYELQEEDDEHDAVYVFVKIIEQTQQGEGVFEFTSRYKVDIGQDEPIEVIKCKLYKFDRKGTRVGNRSEDIVPYEGDGGSQGTDEEPVQPQNLKEARREIAEALKEIWKLPESERDSAVRRLIRAWHPDKNDNEELATEATKFLYNEVERLKNGGTPGYREPGTERQDGGCARSSGPDFDFRGYGSNYGRRRDRNRQQYDDWRRGGGSQSRESEYEPVNEHEAQIWIRQACVDLDAAKYLYKSNNATFHGLACFHCQQTAEKSLKALLFAKGKLMKQDLQKHETMTLAYRVSRLDARLHEVPQLVVGLHGYYINTRYPQYRPYYHDATIPAEKYTAQDAQLAVNKATNIYEIIKDVLGV